MISDPFCFTTFLIKTVFKESFTKNLKNLYWSEFTELMLHYQPIPVLASCCTSYLRASSGLLHDAGYSPLASVLGSHAEISSEAISVCSLNLCDIEPPPISPARQNRLFV